MDVEFESEYETVICLQARCDVSYRLMKSLFS